MHKQEEIELTNAHYFWSDIDVESYPLIFNDFIVDIEKNCTSGNISIYSALLENVCMPHPATSTCISITSHIYIDYFVHSSSCNVYFLQNLIFNT